MHFAFNVYDALTIRKNPTTQIAITLAEWPGNTFLLWLPEWVGDLWDQWTPEVAHQDFTSTPTGGLFWRHEKPGAFRLESQLEPHPNHLVLEVRVRNLSDAVLRHVVAQNCFHLSRAPDFACGDFSRVFVRIAGEWRGLAELAPSSALPMYYRPGFLESGQTDSWKGYFAECNQRPRADHPLMMCVDRESRRVVATASDDYQCVFHNSGNRYLQCIHSQQAPVPILERNGTAVFRQVILFTEGNRDDCLNYFNRLAI